MARKSDKKIVRVESAPAAQSESVPAAQSGGSGDAAEPAANWKPTAESKGKATTFRIIAAVLWVLAIGGEVFAIFWVLKQTPVNMVLLIGLLVAIGALAVGGSLLWKQANRLDPASKSDKFRFFVQNQLGAIITIIAFLPLIIMIFLNRDMDGKQKALAGGIGIVLVLVAGYFGADFNPPSTEQYSDESQLVVELTGEDLVFWTLSGEVFHLCEDVSAVNLESQDNQIYSGTVADAHAAGKDRLTLQIDQELDQCGLPPRGPDIEEEPEPEEEPEE